MVLFYQALTGWDESRDTVQFTVADYNLSVLEIATIPNLLLTWYFARYPVTLSRTGDLELTQELLSSFLENLSEKRIFVSGITGAWGIDFSELISTGHPTNGDTIILASETIYSPSSTKRFVEVLMQILCNAQRHRRGCLALLAAKRIYFGVGGGVDDFLAVLAQSGGIAKDVWNLAGHGIGRVILQIEAE